MKPNISTNISLIQKKILPILERYGVIKASLFGSLARDEATEDSDIDLLVEIKKNISLFDFIGLKLDLEEALGKKVDLVEFKAIKPLLREYILKDQLPIL